MKYFYISIRRFLFEIKKRIQLWFRFGVHYHRRKAFDNYVSKIRESFNEGEVDFQLLSEFSLFCKKKRFTSEVIKLLEELKGPVAKKTIVNYFLLQNYARQNRSLLLKQKDTSFIKNKAIALIEETLAAAFGNDYMSQIGATLSPGAGSISSKFFFTDAGWENFGFVEHHAASENKSFLTKFGISFQGNHELQFYSLAPELYPQLKEVIPAATDIRISDDSLISLLTMEKASGAASSREQFKNLIELHINYVQTCRYVPDKGLPLTEALEAGYFHLFISKAFHLFLSQSFCRIHDEKEFLKLNKWVEHELLNTAFDPKIKEAVVALVQQLEEIKLNELVSPEKHYSLCHGDYYLSNVLYDEKTDKFTIIDWTQCTYGPKLLDIAGLLRNQRESICSFEEMEEMVLHRIDNSEEYNEIDKLLFVYASIIISILFKRASIISEDPDFFFLPAVEKCRELIESVVGHDLVKGTKEGLSER